jgi:hypothetical protein
MALTALRTRLLEIWASITRSSPSVLAWAVVIRDERARREAWLARVQFEEYEKAITTAEGRKRNFMVSAGEATDEEIRAEWSAKANEEALRVRKLREQYDALVKVLTQQQKQAEALESLVAVGARALDHLRTATFDDKRTTLHAFKVQIRCWSKDHQPKDEFS